MESMKEAKTAPFHCHFGLGRLGCGLVIPALQAKGTPFCIVQRASHQWGEMVEEAKKIRDSGEKPTVTFLVNGEEAGAPLEIVTERSGLDDSNVGKCSLVALSEDKELLKALVQRATSFSSSLGPALKKVLPPNFDMLEDKPENERPILYACENEHGPVDELEKEVSSKVNSVKCMVDRICIDRTINPKKRTVEAVAEDFKGKIIVLKPLADHSIVPFSGDVSVPENQETAQFLYKRKFSIVNGIHGALAFLTLRENGAKPEDSQEGQNFPLIKPTEAKGDIKKEIDSWLRVRCVQLIDEFGIATAASAVGLDADDEKAVFQSLLDYGAKILERMSSMDDESDRIFEGDRLNCWTNRVKPLWVFIDEKQFAGSDTPMGRFIDYSKLDEAWAKAKIEQLTEYAAEMCKQRDGFRGCSKQSKCCST